MRSFHFKPRLIVVFTLASLVGFSLSGVARGQDLVTPEAVQPEAVPGAPREITEEEAQEAADRAVQAMAEEDYETAAEQFTLLFAWGQQNLITEDGQRAFVAGLEGRWRALIALQEYADVERETEGILEQQPRFIPALLIRGDMRLERGFPDQAQEDFEAVLRLNRRQPHALFGLGKSLVQLREWQAAVRPLTRAIELEHEPAEAHRLRGTARAFLFQYNDAIEDLRQAISLNPDDHEAYFMLAVVHLSLEEFQAAVDELGRSIEHYTPPPQLENQPFIQGYLLRSSAYIELGKRSTAEEDKRAAYEAAAAEAEKLLQQLDERNPNTAAARAQTLYSRGVGERMAGRIEDAIQSFSLALELNPEFGEAYLRRGICWHLIGEDQMALADFIEATYLDYDDARPRMWEGFMHAKLGDYHQAHRAYSDALAASDRYTPAYANRALAYMALGEYDKAVANFDDALRLDPGNADFYFRRGVAYQLMGDFERASQSFGSALRFDSEHADARRRMAEVLSRLGQTEQAAEHRRRAQELAPQE